MMVLVPPVGRYCMRLPREGYPKVVLLPVAIRGEVQPYFCFSGPKTAVTKYVRESGLRPVANGEEPSQGIKDLAASFQSVVVRSLVGTTRRIAEEYYPKTLIVAGGVACNGKLKDECRAMAVKLGVP